jgi:outer membrane immunogenic protein
MKKKTWAGAALLFAVSVGAATAAAAAPPAPSPWDGFYVGALGTYGWGSTTAAFSAPDNILNWAALDMNTSGGLFGGTVGYNFSLQNSWVLGVEGDLSWGSISGTGFLAATGGSRRDPGYNPNDTDGKFHQSYLGTIRGRFGFSTGGPAAPTLWYVTGGMAFSDGNREIMNNTVGDSLATASHSGWVVGAGVEHKFSRHWSLKGEVLYTDLGTEHYDSSTSSVVTDVHLTNTLLRVGLNYGF